MRREILKLTQLDNGLRVATDTDPNADTVTIMIGIGVGSRHETEENSGISHFIEHMLFKGTDTRSAFDIVREIEGIGGTTNAATGQEDTSFQVTVRAQYADMAFDILADMVLRSRFFPKDIELERNVILTEIADAADQPTDYIEEQFLRTAYKNHALGQPIAGSVRSVESIKRADLIGFNALHYVAPNIVISAAGAIEHSWLVEKSTAVFSHLEGRKPFLPLDGLYTSGDWRQADDLENAHAIIGFPCISNQSSALQTCYILSCALGGGMSSRLFQEVREKRGLVYSIDVGFSLFSETGILNINLSAAPDKIAQGIQVSATELRTSARTINEEEIKRAKAQVLGIIAFQRERTSGRAQRLLDDVLTHNRVIPIKETFAKIDAVTHKDVLRLATDVFSSAPVVAAYGNISAVPSYEAIHASLKSAPSLPPRRPKLIP